ncbi:MAG: hypothetical protein VX278_11995 [Myxococcota bacterium]|nr:hypothetical protein [Myxococcota bacterium]
MIALSILLACSSKQTAQECTSITDELQKDECYHNEVLLIPSTKLDELIIKAKSINDPMIRGAAVSAWVRDHNTEITQKQGMELCELLDGRDRFYCVRRLSSPHLKR